jgi:Arc/MetJ family transcription regulator
MHRTQLYLDDDLWKALRARARKEKTTVSSLVREAARERYLENFEDRKRAMLAFIGIRKDRADIGDSVQYVRDLRRGDRIERLGKP